MSPRLHIAIHPDEIAIGAALIAAAAGAVRRPSGKIVAAWDYVHTMAPLNPEEEGVARMVEAAGRQIGAASECFRFMAAPQPRLPGLIPPTLSERRATIRLRFEPAVRALAHAVRAKGAFGLMVSNGECTLSEPEATAPYAPGILRLSPGRRRRAEDTFAMAAFPTLFVTRLVDPGRLSAHEVLDHCGHLAAALAVAVAAVRRPQDGRTPRSGRSA